MLRHRLAGLSRRARGAARDARARGLSPLSGLLATHADWDHLLGRIAFPGAALGVAETTAARLTAEPGVAARKLRTFDEEWYVDRPGPLSLGQVQALPVPGRCEIGETDLELHPADGHTADGMAIWIGWARVLVAGDYLSPVEVPMISDGGSRDAYIATLRRLEPLVDAAAHVVPGHGEAIDGARAAAILREDLNYLAKLPDAELADGAPRRRAARDPCRERQARTSGLVVIQHVAIEVQEADVDDCVAFWALLGFTPVPAPAALAARSTWVQAGDTQIHLLYADDPVIAAEGHVAVIVADHDATLAALRDAGFEPQPRTEYWGSPRAFVRSPAGHRVEFMAFAPGP